eukprot:CAMPEP_0182446100 /NCGR_PEP_ID=MMETSP1172-20130603/3986_1 /TAXON_ID=708627 /ORGANISM="Timspurckia oligopyrenoides, Strain CCMP3278" /LENGTH=251 /DNA_ID=CAMNT_0024641981 /DNA_START=249 /DNA_END=1001 /DNA_ORIENTATION=-
MGLIRKNTSSNSNPPASLLDNDIFLSSNTVLTPYIPNSHAYSALLDSDRRHFEQHNSKSISSISSTFLEHNQLKILITNSPTNHTLNSYSKLLLKYNITHLVRVSENTYDSNALCEFYSKNSTSDSGEIHKKLVFYDLYFSQMDEGPSERVVREWMRLLHDIYYSGKSEQRVGIHCLSGLGRGPMLVALGIIVFERLSAFESVGIIRGKRRGAINSKQFVYLEKYERELLHKECSEDNKKEKNRSMLRRVW